MFGVSSGQSVSEREPTLPEINAKIPRKVYLYDGQTALVFSLIFLGFGAIWFGAYSHFYVQQSQHREVLKQAGRETLATITRFVSGRRTTSLHYRFRVEDADYQGEIQLDYQNEPDGSPESRPYLHVGEQIPVQFLPSNPSINHLTGWEWWSGWDLIPQLFMLMFPGGGIAGLIMLYRERTLARRGWVTEGRVTGCAANGKMFSVYYEFHTQDGMLAEGSNSSTDEQEVDSKVQVIYLRKNPKRNDLYPLSSFHMAE